MIIHKINFPLYGIIILLSIAIGLFYIYKSLRKEEIEKRIIFYYMVLFVPFALICGKMYTMIVNFEDGLTLLNAGLSSYGGLLGVVIASILFEYIKPSDGKFIKYSVLSLPLIYGLSKMACTVAGCCHGIPYTGPLAVKYVDVLDKFVFPVQFLEVVTGIIIFFIVNKFKNNKNITYITLMVVSIVKFATDFLRYEHIKVAITANQIFSIVILVVTLIVFIINKKRLTNK